MKPVSDDILAGFPRLGEVLAAELGPGAEAGVQLSIAHQGRLFDLAVGENGRSAPMTPQAVVPWTCSSKPIGALAFGRAWDAGLIHPDHPVAEYLPEYGAAGKSRVRIRDLLTHTTGVPDPLAGVDVDSAGGALPGWDELEQVVWEVIVAAEPKQPPGTAMMYNPLANWFTLDRVLAAVNGGGSGDSYRDTCRMLGLSATLGLARSSAASAVRCVAAAGEEENLRRVSIASTLPLPGTGVWGTMRDLRAVGEALLACTDAAASASGPALLAPATAEAMTCTHWPAKSRRLLSTTDFDYGLGFMTLPHLFGDQCSYRAYGHAGGNNSALLVDPQNRVVLAVYWNRRLADVPTVTRRKALVDAVYQDLDVLTATR